MRAVFIILNMCHAVRVTGVLFHAISPIPKPSNKYPDKLKKNPIQNNQWNTDILYLWIFKWFSFIFSYELEMSSPNVFRIVANKNLNMEIDYSNIVLTSNRS